MADAILESVAVLAAIGYLVFAIRQNILCWPCAGVSTAIYVYLFVDARLYMESVLNVFYFGMAAYGWYCWTTGRTDGGEMPVTRWPAARHIPAVATVCVLSLVTGFMLSRYSDAAYPYVDSMTTWAAIWATFLTARKVFENWWYWLVIDAVSAVIYWTRGLELTALLYAFYVALIPLGIASWQRSWREQHA